MTEEKKDGGLVQLGALWKKDKDGNQFLSGSMGSANVFVFKNKWKKNDKDPDYKIFVGRRSRAKQEKSESQDSSQSDEL